MTNATAESAATPTVFIFHHESKLPPGFPLSQTLVGDRLQLAKEIIGAIDTGEDILIEADVDIFEFADILYRYLEFEVVIIRGFPGEMVSGTWAMTASSYPQVSVDQIMEMRSMSGDREDTLTPSKEDMTLEQRVAQLDARLKKDVDSPEAEEVDPEGDDE